jgi:acetate kinase
MSIFLTCNAGSANTKLAAFDTETMERKGHAVIHNNAAELTEWLCSIGSLDIVMVGHRVVHGGLEFRHPVAITESVLNKLKGFIPLAPLHQPAAIKLIEEVQKLYPKIPQIACFDTAFHHTMPDVERRLPLPRKYHDEGIMRYGFHGLSYQHIADVLPEIAGKRLAHGRVVVAHLGGGSSACAMKDLKSVASTMGFSTLDGLMMGTRCGTLDAGVVLHLLTEKKMPVSEVTELLYYQSGLKGVSGISGDMQELLESKRVAAQESIELYCHLAAKQIAGLLPALGGMDALVFTGGIGENAAYVRERIADLLRWIDEFSVYVIPTDEEKVIAEHCKTILKGKSHAA